MLVSFSLFLIPVMSTHVIASSSVGGGHGSSIVGGNFKVGKKIGEGSFGVVFEGEAKFFFFSVGPKSYRNTG